MDIDEDKVDEAVLALSDYQMGDPLSAFYADLPSYISEQYGRDSIILSNPIDVTGQGGDGTGLTTTVPAELPQVTTGGSTAEAASDTTVVDGAYSGEKSADVPAAAPSMNGGAAGRDASGAPVSVRTNFDAFLKHYEAEICVDTKLFAGMDELLAGIEARGLRWGIVTNKSTRLTKLIVKAMDLDARASCVVCGDTTPHLKPNPASLLHAANALGLAPAECLYLGDDLRDIQAARAAGMPCGAVAWGYGETYAAWQADFIAERPVDLLARL